MMTPLNTFAQKMMQTINGKLIVLNSSKLDEVQQRIEQIDRKFDRLETVNGDFSTNESLQQLNKLRQIYTRFFWIVVAASLGLTVVNFLGSRHSFCSVRASENVPYSDVESVRMNGDR